MLPVDEEEELEGVAGEEDGDDGDEEGSQLLLVPLRDTSTHPGCQ